jgi:16S rRNA (cytidine1402-2'-O)-methyltransferase
MIDDIAIQQSFQKPSSHGTLYLVGTPIGNLEDMTYRAIRILRESTWIAAEDTRHTRKLLSHYEITGKLIAYHEHNKSINGPKLLDKLRTGDNIALVTDAGLPGISDPGTELVQAAIQAGLPVVPVPGPNAALTALIASGLSSTTFAFIGFLPREKKKSSMVLNKWQYQNSTLIIYESPHRILNTLRLIYELWGSRQVVLARELTKRYEEFVRGEIVNCIEYIEANPPLGEYCLLVAGVDRPVIEQTDTWWQELTIAEHLATYEQNDGLTRQAALKKIAVDRNIPRRELYALLHRKV